MSSTTPNSYDAWFTAAVTPADKLEELKQINIYVEDVRNAEAADEADELIDIAKYLLISTLCRPLRFRDFLQNDEANLQK
jgi:hypothetical protein